MNLNKYNYFRKTNYTNISRDNMAIRTVEWKNNSVIMIDQTKLPNSLEYVTYTDYNLVAEAIRTLVV